MLQISVLFNTLWRDNNCNIKKLICEEGFFFADLGFYGEEVGFGLGRVEH